MNSLSKYFFWPLFTIILSQKLYSIQAYLHSIPGIPSRGTGKMKSFLLRLCKNRSSKSLAVKTICSTQYHGYLKYLNPKGEDSSCKMVRFIATYSYFKTKMDVAGLIFELHLPNFENQYNF